MQANRDWKSGSVSSAGNYAMVAAQGSAEGIVYGMTMGMGGIFAGLQGAVVGSIAAGAALNAAAQEASTGHINGTQVLKSGIVSGLMAEVFAIPGMIAGEIGSAGDGVADNQAIGGGEGAESAGDDVADNRTIKVGDGEWEEIPPVDPETLAIIKAHGLTLDEFQALKLTPTSELTTDQLAIMRSIRDAIPAPTNTTPMTRVISQSDYSNYTKESDPYTTIKGYTARTGDLGAPQTPADYVATDRLDYKKAIEENTYPPDQPMYVIEYTTSTPDKLTLPYNADMVNGGEVPVLGDPPFMGNAFTASTNGTVVPEYYANGAKIETGTIYRINLDGTKDALYVFEDGKFIPKN